MKDIALIQTGGTIAMHQKKEGTGILKTRASSIVIDQVPEINAIANIELFDLFFEDSSNLEPTHWISIAQAIEEIYARFDGFVVLHGTDTMAYSASFLSFAIRNLGKPIIFTGSQVPIGNIRSDAKRNVINAIEMATFPLFEVSICFNDRVFRGNRSTKMNIEDYDAFESPNYPALAQIGINIQFQHEYTLPFPSKNISFDTSSNTQILHLKLFPGFNPTPFLDLLPNYNALVIQGYGCGNFPIKGYSSLIPMLKKASEINLPTVMTSQAVYDAVDLQKYESGKIAHDLGVISAGDMTFEAVITKLICLLGKEDDPNKIKSMFVKNWTGEISL